MHCMGGTNVTHIGDAKKQLATWLLISYYGFIISLIILLTQYCFR